MKRKNTSKDKRPSKKSKKFPSTPSRSFVARSAGTPLAITERKYFDSDGTGALAQLTTNFNGGELDPAANSLFTPTTGDDYNNRTGRKVQVVSIKITGRIDCAAQADQVALDSAAMCRVLLVQDKQTNAAQLNSEDVITSGAASGATLMFQNPAFFGRFVVLKDKRWIFQGPTVTYDGTNIEQGGLQKYFKWNLKFKKPITIHFNGTNGGTIADIVDNSFHVIGGCSNNSLAPTLTYKCRTTFLDA